MQPEKTGETSKTEDLDYIKALGRLQHDVETIIKNSSALDKPGIVSMLKLALEQSDIDCSLIAEKIKLMEVKKDEGNRNG